MGRKGAGSTRGENSQDREYAPKRNRFYITREREVPYARPASGFTSCSSINVSHFDGSTGDGPATELPAIPTAE